MEGQNLSLLESRAVMVSISKQYSQELNQFMDFGRPRGLDTKDEDMMDGTMVEYLNQMFLQGHQSYRADRLIAAVLHYYPEYGRMGAKKLRRTWRAIRGYRKLTPGKSRKAYPLALWCAMAVELKKQGKLRMSVFLMLSVSTYARPSELLRARLFSMVRPHSGVTGHWSMLLSPEEQGTQTKTGEFDTSLILDSPYLQSWGDRLFEELKKGHPEERLWDFDYGEYNRSFREAAKRLGVVVTPYQTRHSGPSIDRSRNYRSNTKSNVEANGDPGSQSTGTRRVHDWPQLGNSCQQH